eukprot:Sspe_Gene.44701::Locus_21935_Transcript_1_1_Confidence_1.000_Length_1740::g.44701::m.44701/K00844/HK; hexokinase
MATGRLATLLSHLQHDKESGETIAKLQIIYDLISSFDLSQAKLNQIIVHFIREMHYGLEADTNSAFKMLPSFVYRGDTKVSGSFLALDLGGTNFRVLSCQLKDGQTEQQQQVKYQIPPALMGPASSGKELFGFIARCVKEFIDTHRIESESSPLGFTFSFPVNQTALAAGTLLTWTKGFSTPGVEGEEVVGLLQDAFKEAGITSKVSALCNDTVGTLVTGYFVDPSAEVGLILGTGSNACYWEEVPNIKKLPSPSGWNGKQQMCINMEWGHFDSDKKAVLPFTPMDNEVDQYSPNRGKQRFEKMISGMYLGEIARLTLLHLVQHGVLGTVPSLIGRGSLTSAVLSDCLADHSEDLDTLRSILRKSYRMELSIEHAKIIRQVFSLVVQRSARLAAAGVAAILLKTGRVQNAKVCVDGSVFEKTPGYQEELYQCLDSILRYHGYVDHNVKLVLTSNGSGVGAALIAALAK